MIFVAAAAAGLAYFLLAPDRYEAEADVLVTPITDDDEELKGLGLLSNPTGSVYTTARLLERPQVARRVTERLNLNISRKALLDKIEITPLPQSNLVTIKAEESSPEQAALLANAFASVLIEQRSTAFQARLNSGIERLQARLAAERLRSGGGVPEAGVDESERLLEERIAAMRAYRGGPDPTLEIWSPAAAPDGPKGRSALVIVVAFAGALLVAAAAVLVLEFLNPKLRRRSSLPEGLATLAHVPWVSRTELRDALSGERQLSEQFWDTWRIVRSRLAAGGSDREPYIVVVTSATRGEGKSVASSSLAVTLAAAGTKTVLVDANLRDPGMAEMFGVGADPGLAEVLEGRVAARDALTQAPRTPGLRLLTAGSSSQQTIDLLDRPRIDQLFQGLRREAEVVIIDSPALNASAEAVALAAAADVVMGSAQLGRSRMDDLQEFGAILGPLGVPVLGVVVHGTSSGRGRQVPAPGLREPGLGTEPSTLRSEVA